MINFGSLYNNKGLKILLVLFFSLFISQKNYADSLDSLKTILNKTKNDSVKIAIISQITELCDEGEIITYANQNLKIVEKAFKDNKISFAFYNLEKARSMYNCGVYHFAFTSNYIETINYVLNSIKLIEDKPNSNIHIDDLLASAYNTIAAAYMRIGKNELAEKYLLKSIAIDKKNGNEDFLTNDYNNIASSYYMSKDFDKAIFYFNLAISIARENNDTSLLAVRYCNIAEMYLTKRDFNKTQSYLDLAVNNLKNQRDSSNYFQYYKIKFKLYLLTDKIKEAKNTISIIQKIDKINNYEYSDYLRYLHDYYVRVGDYKAALLAYKQYRTIQETAVNESIKVKSEVKQLTFDFEKKQLDEKNKNELELTKQHEKRQRQTFISIAIFFICIVIAVFSFIFYKKLKLTQKQNKTIEQQNSKIQNQHQLLEVKNKSITDSINYSKSIQSTLLTHYNQFNSYFKQSYIIYEPKDIIGGDFYWTQKTDNNNLIIVVGDCTGHGVPGALISVLAMEALNKIYLTISDLTDLDELIKKLRNEFNKYYESNSLVSIGIDLSIIYFDRANNKVILGGSGASIIGFENNIITKYKFDSYNIGGKMPAIYTKQTQKINLVNEQVFYLFTDGVIDMKGGGLNKKYSMKNLENLLEQFQEFSFAEQKLKVEQLISEWNKDSERIDDITFLAIKL